MPALSAISWLTIVLTSAIFSATVSSQQAYPPPGRMVDIGGRSLHLNCKGKGSPTVILMAGGGAFSIDWAFVQPKVAESTRVCSYDRAGLGWSDAGPAEDSVEETVRDLHALLQASDERGPYVLVGASIGGIFIQAYQRAFPKDIAALVFSNSSNRIGFQVKDKTGLIGNSRKEKYVELTRFRHQRIRSQPARGFFKLPPDLQKVRLSLDVRMWEHWKKSGNGGPEGILSWRKEFLTEFDSTDAGKQPPLGSLPVVVISSEAASPEFARRSRDEAGRPRLSQFEHIAHHRYGQRP